MNIMFMMTSCSWCGGNKAIYTMCIVLDETYIGTGQRSNQLNITVYITMVLQPVLVHCTCDSRQSVGQKNTVQV